MSDKLLFEEVASLLKSWKVSLEARMKTDVYEHGEILTIQKIKNILKQINDERRKR